MSDQPNMNLFNLSIDDQSSIHLKETAKWARFLGIVGFVICGLIVCGALFAGSVMGTVFSRVGFGEFGMLIIVIYLLFAALYFFPSLFLYQFGTRMKKALASNDQADLNYSLSRLKAFFRFWAILTIVVLTFYALALLVVLATAGLR